MAKSGNFPQGPVTSYKAQIRAAYMQKRMEVFAITEAVNVIINNLNERRNGKSTIEIILSSGAWVNTIWKKFGLLLKTSI